MNFQRFLHCLSLLSPSPPHPPTLSQFLAPSHSKPQVHQVPSACPHLALHLYCSEHPKHAATVSTLLTLPYFKSSLKPHFLLEATPSLPQANSMLGSPEAALGGSMLAASVSVQGSGTGVHAIMCPRVLKAPGFHEETRTHTWTT